MWSPSLIFDGVLIPRDEGSDEVSKAEEAGSEKGWARCKGARLWRKMNEQRTREEAKLGFHLQHAFDGVG